MKSKVDPLHTRSEMVRGREKSLYVYLYVHLEKRNLKNSGFRIPLAVFAVRGISCEKAREDGLFFLPACVFCRFGLFSC